MLVHTVCALLIFFLGTVNMFSRAQLLQLRDFGYASGKSSGIITHLRKLGICNTSTHRGVRGSGHRKPITTVLNHGRSESTARINNNSVNHSNLTTVKLESSANVIKQQPLSFGLINARSVRNKCTQISDYIIENSIDILALTETWLGDENKDQILLGNLCPPGYSIIHEPRSYSKGGGIGLVYKSNTNIKKLNHKQYVSFESLQIQVSVPQQTAIHLSDLPAPAKSKK